jgi:hypothetical protein
MLVKNISIRIATLFGLLIITIFNTSSGFSKQDDTVKIYNVSVPPLIEGIGNDACWQNTNWQTIDQVWINYGEKISSSDYSGRYKVVWSSEENLLYFLVEITDDHAIGGYVAGHTAAIYNYDILEVFLDENRSKGPNDVTNPLTGKNIENAFAYHIYSDFPNNGEIFATPVVEDIPGPRNEHFPEFAIKGADNFYTREFSLKVYDSTYDDSNRELSRVQLKAGKIMGLSLAYCDNDANDGLRDNFFGSVWVPADKYNSHWMEADEFGVAKLFAEIPTKIADKNQDLPAIEIYPNPATSFMNIKSSSELLKFELFDIAGKSVISQQCGGSGIIHIPLDGLKQGIYYVKIMNKNRAVVFKKITKT